MSVSLIQRMSHMPTCALDCESPCRHRQSCLGNAADRSGSPPLETCCLCRRTPGANQAPGHAEDARPAEQTHIHIHLQGIASRMTDGSWIQCLDNKHSSSTVSLVSTKEVFICPSKGNSNMPNFDGHRSSGSLDACTTHWVHQVVPGSSACMITAAWVHALLLVMHHIWRFHQEHP